MTASMKTAGTRTRVSGITEIIDHACCAPTVRQHRRNRRLVEAKAGKLPHLPAFQNRRAVDPGGTGTCVHNGWVREAFRDSFWRESWKRVHADEVMLTRNDLTLPDEIVEVAAREQ